MKNKRLIVSCWLLLTGFFVFASEGGEYALVKKEGAVSLYEKWITSANGKKTREIKATFLVKSDINSVLRLLMNQSKGRQWNMNTSDYKIVKTSQEKTWITYIRYSLPWPMADQDCCLQFTISELTQPGIAEVVFFSASHDQFPQKGKVKRISGTKGRWLLQHNSNGTLAVTYTISTDRSSSVPQWISDPIIQKQLFKGFSRFISLLENNDI